MGIGKHLVFSVLLIVLLAAVAFLVPWNLINWGRISVLPAATITVTGEAQLDKKSQLASFSAGVTAYNDDKQKAVDEVNTKMEKIIAAVKAFGIAEADIKTQSVSVNQNAVELQRYPTTTKPGQWIANNTIEIKLRDVGKTSTLTDLLNSSGATQVYGPSFGLDSADKSSEGELLKKAIDNAQEKAEVVAQASGKRLGPIITVSESGGRGIYPAAALEKADTSAPIEPGTQTTSKSVTVVFELK